MSTKELTIDELKEKRIAYGHMWSTLTEEKSKAEDVVKNSKEILSLTKRYSSEFSSAVNVNRVKSLIEKNEELLKYLRPECERLSQIEYDVIKELREREG